MEETAQQPAAKKAKSGDDEKNIPDEHLYLPNWFLLTFSVHFAAQLSVWIYLRYITFEVKNGKVKIIRSPRGFQCR